jgi:hypothetical protein
MCDNQLRVMAVCSPYSEPIGSVWLQRWCPSGLTLAVPVGAMDRRRRSFGALRRRRSFRRQGGFWDSVEEYAVPAACEPTGNALRGGLVGEGAYPNPVIRTFRALALGHVRLGEPILPLFPHGLGVALLFKGSYLLRRPPARASRWRGALRATPWPGVCQGGQGGRADPRRGHQREQGGREWADAGRWDCVKSGFIFPIRLTLPSPKRG